jgi:hypothetical protein
VIFTGCAASISLKDKNEQLTYQHFGINEWNRIVIEDADRNLDPKTRQMVKVFIHSRKSDDIENLVLTETETNSGIFSGVVFSLSHGTKEKDGFLQTTSGEAIDIYYHDRFSSDGVGRLIKKTYYTYYPILILSGD